MAKAKKPIVDDMAIPEPLQIFRGSGGGIESWLNAGTPAEVISRLNKVRDEPLSFEHLNQLLILSHEAGFSQGFYEHYWLSTPSDVHPYNVRSLANFSETFLPAKIIVSPEHLAWGLERLYIDALLFFGNVREGYRQLRNKRLTELKEFFRAKRYDTEQLVARGAPLPLERIPKDNRYLIAEVACKTYDAPAFSDLRAYLTERFVALKSENTSRITARALLKISEEETAKNIDQQLKFDLDGANFSLTEILDSEIRDNNELDGALSDLAKKFDEARKGALRNTELYLSMAYDLDAYVATSMRNRDDFRTMADRCEYIFEHQSVKKYKLRYFDPTLSAAQSHEDKGLIECLMVKCAKLLIYMAGQKESYGKDAEAAMALSMGKPVIFLCDPNQRTSFYRDVHPLSRLIDFATGVAVGAIVTDKAEDVPLLIDRIFSNSMEYRLERKRENYLLLKEKHTNSVVRVQTDDKLLAETFWNYYHSNPFNYRNSH